MDRMLLQFMAIVEAGSFSKAAEALSISQPALTHNMKKLEDGMGVRLLDRTSRGVRMTEYGETLYQSAEMMQRTYSHAITQIERQRAELDQGLSIGTGYSSWFLFLRDMSFEYARNHPHAPVNIILCNALRGMEQLLSRDIMLLISHHITDLARENELEFVPLGIAQDNYFARIGHPLHGMERSRTEVLSWPTTIAFPTETRPRRLLRHGSMTPADLPVGSAGHHFTSNSLQACIEFACATDAVLIHNNILANYLSQQNLISIEMRPEDRPRPWLMGIYLLRDRRDDPVIAAIVPKILQLWQERVPVVDQASAEPSKKPA